MLLNVDNDDDKDNYAAICVQVLWTVHPSHLYCDCDFYGYLLEAKVFLKIKNKNGSFVE